ncbi:uncharacterized transposon-derived protein F54H12.3 [Trichonephila clavipes]|nr:uncharacterized transposon-derived protein F54H12.3 [Trichonephila clavipes]
MEPSAVSEGNQTQVWLTLYGQSLKESKSIFKVGDTVRISREKLNFEKGYEQNWTREIFTIHQILSRNPIVYRVKDLSGEIIQGTFYPQELQKVSDSGFYPVEKVIRTRKRNGNAELLVRRVPPGCYETVPDILKGMHLELHQNKIEFIYPSVTKKVKIKLGDQVRVVLYKGLAELLGFEPGEYKKSVESPYIADPTASFPIMYAYCDLVEPQIVGHTQAPLLKIIKVEGKDAEKRNGLPYYAEQSFQKGYGIGGWFKRLFRTALPFLKSGAKSVGKEVLKTSTQIANDMLEGQSFPESARQRSNETGKKLIKKAIQKADEMIGRGKKHQRYKRKRKGMKATSYSKSKKVRGRDIFDH